MIRGIVLLACCRCFALRLPPSPAGLIRRIGWLRPRCHCRRDRAVASSFTTSAIDLAVSQFVSHPSLPRLAPRIAMNANHRHRRDHRNQRRDRSYRKNHHQSIVVIATTASIPIIASAPALSLHLPLSLSESPSSFPGSSRHRSLLMLQFLRSRRQLP